jgi:hypothetical protein
VPFSTTSVSLSISLTVVTHFYLYHGHFVFPEKRSEESVFFVFNVVPTPITIDPANHYGQRRRKMKELNCCRISSSFIRCVWVRPKKKKLRLLPIFIIIFVLLFAIYDNSSLYVNCSGAYVLYTHLPIYLQPTTY